MELKLVVPDLLDGGWEYPDAPLAERAYNLYWGLGAIARTRDWRSATTVALITAGEDAAVMNVKIASALDRYCERGYQKGMMLALFAENTEVFAVVLQRWRGRALVFDRPEIGELLTARPWRIPACGCQAPEK